MYTISYTTVTEIREETSDGTFYKYFEYEMCLVSPPVKDVVAPSKCVALPTENQVMVFAGELYLDTLKLSDVKFIYQ